MVMDNDNLINTMIQNKAQAQVQPKAPQKNPQLRTILAIAAAGVVSFVVGIVFANAFLKSNESAPDKPPTPSPAPTETPAARTSNGISYDFLTLETSGENLIYSPLSIKNGLALLSAGANGATKMEIENVLGSAEVPEYTNVADRLSLANAVFVRDTFSSSVLSNYTDAVVNNYGAEVIYDDFVSSTNMDNWVKNKTFNLIDNIGIEPTVDTRMVLANALAIQLDWQHPFDGVSTNERSFFLESGEETQVNTMRETFKSNDIYYRAGDSETVVALPLKSVAGAELEFDAIMPSGNLSDYVKNLDQATVDAALADLTPASTPEDGIDLYIPKFKFDYALNFQADLEALGIKSAFNADMADFSAMASEPLYVSQAAHKANIDFSEDGIKAAAVTSFEMWAGALADEPEPVVVKIDHPFLFLIRDKANNGEVWFTGAVYKPEG